MLKFSTSAQCPICQGHWLDYKNGEFFCEECQKIINKDNINQNLADLYELNIPYTSNKYDKRLEDLRAFCDKYNADFLGFDPFDEMKNNHNNWSGMLDIGWEKGFPDNLPVIIKDLKKILR